MKNKLEKYKDRYDSIDKIKFLIKLRKEENR